MNAKTLSGMLIHIIHIQTADSECEIVNLLWGKRLSYVLNTINYNLNVFPKNFHYGISYGWNVYMWILQMFYI